MTTLALNVKSLHERYGIFLGFRLAVAGGAILAITSDVVPVFVIVIRRVVIVVFLLRIVHPVGVVVEE